MADSNPDLETIIRESQVAVALRESLKGHKKDPGEVKYIDPLAQILTSDSEYPDEATAKAAYQAHLQELVNMSPAKVRQIMTLREKEVRASLAEHLKPNLEAFVSALDEDAQAYIATRLSKPGDNYRAMEKALEDKDTAGLRKIYASHYKSKAAQEFIASVSDEFIKTWGVYRIRYEFEKAQVKYTEEEGRAQAGADIAAIAEKGKEAALAEIGMTAIDFAQMKAQAEARAAQQAAQRQAQAA